MATPAEILRGPGGEGAKEPAEQLKTTRIVAAVPMCQSATDKLFVQHVHSSQEEATAKKLAVPTSGA
jgi:hypothetical protein